MSTRLSRPRFERPHGNLALAASTVPALVLFGLAGFRRRKSSLREAGLLLTVLFLAAVAVGISGCSGDPNAAPSGTYTIPVNITANGTTSSITVTLIVK